MYYKYKCRARVTTRHFGDREYIKSSSVEHTHAKIFPEDSDDQRNLMAEMNQVEQINLAGHMGHFWI